MTTNALHISEEYVNPSDRTVRNLNLFWNGFMLYTLSFTLSMSTFVNYIFCNLLQIIGLLMFLPAASYLITFRIENTYLKVVYYLYLIWLLGVILRVEGLDYAYFKLSILNAWFGIWLYLVPLVMLMDVSLYGLKKIFKVIITLGIFYVIYSLVFVKYLLNPDPENILGREMFEHFARTLAITCGFILFSYKYHSKNVKYIAVFVLVFMLLFALIRARRGLILFTVIMLVIPYLLYLSQTRGRFLLIFFTLLILSLVSLFGYELFRSNQDSLVFGGITERGLQNTRTSVEDCFFNDMSTVDWIVGKGLTGAYYCPGIDQENIVDRRDLIETDLLQVILKGGVISLGFLFLIAIPAIIKGLFFSENLLSKAAAMWILWAIGNMYPATTVTFTMQYVLFWVCIAICYSREIREMSEDVLVDYFRYGEAN